MTNSSQGRQPAGVPTGGQFAAGQRGESQIDLSGGEAPLLGTPEEWERMDLSAADVAAWQRHGFTALEAEDWRHYGHTASGASLWMDRGFHSGSMVEDWQEERDIRPSAALIEERKQAWSDAGFPDDETEAWQEAHFSVCQATDWKREGFDNPDEASEWRQAGVESPALAGEWVRFQFTPARVEMVAEGGFTHPDQIVGLLNSRPTRAEVTLLQAAFPEWDASGYLDGI